jgi:hypothetical protein
MLELQWYPAMTTYRYSQGKREPPIGKASVVRLVRVYTLLIQPLLD